MLEVKGIFGNNQHLYHEDIELEVSGDTKKCFQGKVLY